MSTTQLVPPVSQSLASNRPTTLSSAMQARESQSVQVAMQAAKLFPRNEKHCLDRILNSCTRESLAAVSQYQYARGGTDIMGPSIRLAEAVAQQWGNIESGWRELDRYTDSDGVGVSVVEAFAWDLESNYRVPRVFNVRHYRDTRGGGYKIEEERDIYELCANMAARRVRACILAVIPGDIVDEAMDQCQATLKASADCTPEAQQKLIKAFSDLGVAKSQIEDRIQRRIGSITAAQVISMKRIYASIRDGMSEIGDWFETAKESDSDAPKIDPFAEKGQPAKTEQKPAAETNAAAAQNVEEIA